MTAPTTPVDIIRNLTELTGELQAKVNALRGAEKDAAVKRHTADMVETRAFLALDTGAVDWKKARAKEAADVPEGEAKVAEALVRVLRAEIRALETRIDVGRTYSSAMKAELATLEYGRHP